MKTRTKRAKQSARVGDWVRTERGLIFEVTRVAPIRATFASDQNYGPVYYGDSETALACAVVEIRRR